MCACERACVCMRACARARERERERESDDGEPNEQAFCPVRCGKEWKKAGVTGTKKCSLNTPTPRTHKHIARKQTCTIDGFQSRGGPAPVRPHSSSGMNLPRRVIRRRGSGGDKSGVTSPCGTAAVGAEAMAAAARQRQRQQQKQRGDVRTLRCARQ